MSRLLCGPDAVTVDRTALNWAANHSDGNPESVLYIANQPHRLREIEAQWEGVGRPLELTALTLDEFVDRCYDREEIGGAASRMDQPTRLRLVEQALLDLPSKWSLMEGDGLPPTGLIEQIEDLLSLVEFAGLLSPEAVRNRLIEEGLINLSSELEAITERFYDGRERLPDGSSMTLWAERYRRVANSNPAQCFPHTDAVIIGGFDTFSILASRVVETITETWPTAATFPRLTGTAAPNGVDVATAPAWEFFVDDLGFEPDTVAARESRPPANRRLACAPFRPDADTLSLDETTAETVVLSSLPGEVRYTGRQVQELLSDGVNPNDIGVVVTAPSAYAHRLAGEFSSRSVPYAVARDYDLDGTSVGAALLTALELLDDTETGITDDLRSLLDNPLVEPVLPSWETIDSEQAYDAIADVEELSDVEEPYRAAIDELLAKAETVEDDGGVEAYRHFVACLGIKDTVEDRTTTGSQRVVYRSAERVLNAVERTGDGDDLERARHALGAVSVTDDSTIRDGRVEVLGAAELGMRTFDHVFVLGLTASHFPGSANRLALVNAVTDAHPDFAEADQARRAEYRIASLVAAAESVTLSRPKQQLDGTEYIDAGILAEFRRITDTEPQRRDEFGHLVGQAPTGRRDKIGAREDAQRALATAGARAGPETLGEYATAASSTELFAEAAGSSDWLSTEAAPGEGVIDGIQTASDRGLARPSEHTGWLTPETAQSLSFQLDRLSPTQVERYASCPFRFYAKEVLGLEEEDRDEGPINRGHYVHDVLERFYTELRDEVGSPVSLTGFDQEDLETRLLRVAVDELQAVDDEFDDRWLFELLAGLGDADQNEYYNRTAVDGRPAGILVRFIEEELALYVDPDGRLQNGPLTAAPVWFETKLSFDVDGTTIRGVLDRGETTSDGRTIVRDYKTGYTSSERDTLDGLSFQLPIYAKMLEENVDEVTEAVGGGYYRLKEPGKVSSTAGQIGFIGDGPPNASWRGNSYRDGYGGTPMVYRSSDKPSIETRAGFREFLDDIVPQRLTDIVAGIEAGTFHPTINDPDDAGCSSCQFRDACDIRSYRRQLFMENLESEGRDAYVPPIARGVEWTPTVEEGEN
ncbi:PD-(D/E)XK nuclease family protein [Haloarchaeobius baliensis]|uniref:PD-(D/E)XK nuclease family protein n=1 Tax=Haloarchaeobius baliensis TaxID=1670458 RepID=UPI003F883E7A